MVFKLSPSPKNLTIHLLKNLRVSGPWPAKGGQQAGASGLPDTPPSAESEQATSAFLFQFSH